MHERTVILALLGLLLAALWVCGAFCARILVDLAPPERRKWLLVAWALVFLLMPFPQTWREHFLTGSDPGYWRELAGNWPLYSWMLSGWLWSVVAAGRRRARE
jgi:hypothetical protein